MTSHDAFDRELTGWLEQGAGSGSPDYLAETLAAIDNLHQRGSWAFPERWLPGWPGAARRIPVPALIALLLLALLIGLGFAGGRLRLGPRVPTVFPPPYGLAANGLLAFDSEGQIVLAEPDGSGSSQLHPSERSLVHPNGPSQVGATVSRDGTRVAFWQIDDFKTVGGGACVFDLMQPRPLLVAPDGFDG